MVSFNGEKCVYDVLGNPTTYRNRTLSWQGRRLMSYAKDGRSANFTYDVYGIRTSKTVTQNNTTTTQCKYYYDGNKLIAEKREKTENGSTSTKWLYYIYGVDGVTGLRYNDTTYLFRKNLQGDVTHIYTEDGEQVGHYAYNAFGEVRILQDCDGIATVNPFRYRSYYFDEETGLYYLQTRYYDPETGRFISADSIEYLDPETLGGLNLYAYCGNNPVMGTDPNGTFVLSALLIGLIVGAVVAAIGYYGKFIDIEFTMLTVGGIVMYKDGGLDIGFDLGLKGFNIGIDIKAILEQLFGE